MESCLQNHKDILEIIRKVKRKLALAEIALNRYVFGEWPDDVAEQTLLVSLSIVFSEIRKLHLIFGDILCQDQEDEKVKAKVVT